MIMLLIAGIVVLILLIFLVYYNRISKLSNKIDNSTGQISVQLKKISDIIPSLILCVNGFIRSDKKVMDAVLEARKALALARGIENRVMAGNKLQEALETLFKLTQSYPQLKAHEEFLRMEQELLFAQERITSSKADYNKAIMIYNVMLNQIPGKLFASFYGFKVQKYYQIK